MQEEQTKYLVSTRLPKMLATLVHCNQFLKVFSLTLLVLLLISLFVIAAMGLKEPTIITLNHDGSKGSISHEVTMDAQLSIAIKSYLEKRYTWNDKDVGKKLKEAEDFISPQALKAFQDAVSQISKFAAEKVVTQKLYPEQIKIDVNKGTAFITGERITSIQGLKAVGDLRLELTFEGGRRTKENPWGVYILKEREE